MMLELTDKYRVALRVSALALLLGLALILSGPWAAAQTAGQTDPLVQPQGDRVPLSAPQPQAASWNLTDLLWGIVYIQKTPQKLTARQVSVVKPAVQRVVTGTSSVRNFAPSVRKILTQEQLAFLDSKAAAGELKLSPQELPDAAPGQDPLVLFVLEDLEKKAAQAH